MPLALFGNRMTWPMISNRWVDNFANTAKHLTSATAQDVCPSKPTNITWYSTATSPAHSLLSASTAFYLMKLSPPKKKKSQSETLVSLSHSLFFLLAFSISVPLGLFSSVTMSVSAAVCWVLWSRRTAEEKNRKHFPFNIWYSLTKVTDSWCCEWCHEAFLHCDLTH